VANEPAPFVSRPSLGHTPSVVSDNPFDRLARRARTLAREIPEGDNILRDAVAKFAHELAAHDGKLARRARMVVTAIEEIDLDLAAEQMGLLVESLVERLAGGTPPRPPPAAPPPGSRTSPH
jgi:hypothetical protein